MSDLVAFLRARAAEDEATARAVLNDESDAPCDPARVLREVEAKRAIVDAYETVLGECHSPHLRDRRPRKYGEHDGLRIAVTNLAAVYRDHPDYDPAWAV